VGEVKIHTPSEALRERMKEKVQKLGMWTTQRKGAAEKSTAALTKQGQK
jgi:hypothetical protein